MQKIFDAHAHIFPEGIAHRAVDAVGEFYHLPMRGGGTSEQLLRLGGEAGVGGYLVQAVATTPHQVSSINDFIAKEAAAHREYVGFMTLHPAMDAPEAEIERAAGLGLCGIKLHPDFQVFDIDAPRALPIYREAERRGLPILMHMGDERRDFSAPRRLAAVLERFPGLRVIAAHLGGYRHWKEAQDCLTGSGALFDTSSSLAFLPPEEAAALIDAYGTERVLFGTDYPMWDPATELTRFLALPLKPAQQRRILWDNAATLLGGPAFAD